MSDPSDSLPPAGHIDQIATWIAARQHGIVTRAQLLDAGVPSHVVSRRVAKRLLRPIHQGVYRVGPVLLPRSVEVAACLACGPTAAISHKSASAFWELGRSREAREG